MFTFNRPLFFADFPARTGLRLTPERQGGLTFLLGKFEADAGFTMIRELAYVLATIRWETAHTFQPIREKRFNRATRPREWEHQNRYWRTGFYGRGYVQITWEDNYRRAGRRLAGTQFLIDGTNVVVDQEAFVDNPDYVLHPEVAYAICANGMRQGWFTRKILSEYIRDGTPPDYMNARRVINGTDHAEDIADMAHAFELLLRASATRV